MKTADKYEALRRLPGYIEDWERLQRFSGDLQSETQFEEYVRTMKRKYRISRFPVPLEFTHRKHPYPEISPVEVLTTREPITNVVVENGRMKRILQPETFLHNGQYLTLRINIFAPIKEIEKKVSKIVAERKKSLKEFSKKYRPSLKSKLSERRRETELDHWEIYDSCTVQNKSLSEITQEKYGCKTKGFRSRYEGNMDYREDARYQRVKRAYNKAVKIMNTIKHEATK